MKYAPSQKYGKTIGGIFIINTFLPFIKGKYALTKKVATYWRTVLVVPRLLFVYLYFSNIDGFKTLSGTNFIRNPVQITMLCYNVSSVHAIAIITSSLIRTTDQTNRVVVVTSRLVVSNVYNTSDVCYLNHSIWHLNIISKQERFTL